MSGIDCPACRREIAREFGDWLWKVTNCPFCFAPLSPVMDDYPEDANRGSEFFFATDSEWL